MSRAHSVRYAMESGRGNHHPWRRREGDGRNLVRQTAGYPIELYAWEATRISAAAHVQLKVITSPEVPIGEGSNRHKRTRLCSWVYRQRVGFRHASTVPTSVACKAVSDLRSRRALAVLSDRKGGESTDGPRAVWHRCAVTSVVVAFIDHVCNCEWSGDHDQNASQNKANDDNNKHVLC